MRFNDMSANIYVIYIYILPFLSKVIEKAIAIQIHKHLSKTGIIDDFQSAYKAGHGCETTLLRVFNHIQCSFYDWKRKW